MNRTEHLTQLNSMESKRAGNFASPSLLDHFKAGSALLLGSRSGCGDCRRAYVHLNLLGFRFLALRNVQRQDAVLIIGLDGLLVNGVSQREAARERPVRVQLEGSFRRSPASRICAPHEWSKYCFRRGCRGLWDQRPADPL
jgi:hypothetical protein